MVGCCQAHRRVFEPVGYPERNLRRRGTMPRTPRRSTLLLGLLGVAAAGALLVPTVQAYVEAPMSLGAIVTQSTNVVLMRVESVNKQNNSIVYRKVQDIKGKHPTDVIKHAIGRGGL